MRPSLALSHLTLSRNVDKPMLGGMFTQPEKEYVVPAVRLLTVWLTVLLELSVTKNFPAKLPLCTTSLLRVNVLFVVQLSGLTPLAASSKPGFSSRLEGGGGGTMTVM